MLQFFKLLSPISLFAIIYGPIAATLVCMFFYIEVMHGYSREITNALAWTFTFSVSIFTWGNALWLLYIGASLPAKSSRKGSFDVFKLIFILGALILATATVSLIIFVYYECDRNIVQLHHDLRRSIPSFMEIAAISSILGIVIYFIVATLSAHRIVSKSIKPYDFAYTLGYTILLILSFFGIWCFHSKVKELVLNDDQSYDKAELPDILDA